MKRSQPLGILDLLALEVRTSFPGVPVAVSGDVRCGARVNVEFANSRADIPINVSVPPVLIHRTVAESVAASTLTSYSAPVRG